MMILSSVYDRSVELAGLVLATSRGGSGSSPGHVFHELGLLVVLVIVVVVVALVLRKRFTGSEPQMPATGFSISDLRDMHRKGQISDKEFESAKTLVVGRSRKILDQPPAGGSADPGPKRRQQSGNGGQRSDNDKKPE